VVGDPADLRPPALGRQRGGGVVQRGPAADEQQVAVRIGDAELALSLSAQLEGRPD
jgi:hypothetical protein